MKRCEFENLIDNYLLNRLNEGEKEKFEEHYFNCSRCFAKMAERDDLISVIKHKGSEIFQDIYTAEETRRVSLAEKVLAVFSPRQWALAAASAAAVFLIIFFGVLPNMKTKSPQFFINEDLVRGGSITLISPVIDISAVPAEFRWKSLGEDIEYKIYIYNHELLWSSSTKDNFVLLPEEVKKRMIAGEKYSWQVKAFSPEGTLIAVSSRVQFKVTSPR